MSKKGFALWLVLALVAFGVIIGGCGGGGGGDQSGGGDGDVQFVEPVAYHRGDDTAVTSKIIGAGGGTIEAGNTGAPIDGVRVFFPAGALKSDTKITLGYNSGSMTLNSGTWNGAAISLESDGATEFDAPIEITVPSAHAQYGIVVPYYVTDNGLIRPCQLKDSATEETATFTTWHASYYVCVTPIINFSNTTAYNKCVGYFSPSEDGFGIGNTEGYCFGMSQFTLWYFLNERNAGGPLNPRLSDAAEKKIASKVHNANSIEKFRRSIIGDGSAHWRLRRIIENTVDNSGMTIVVLYPEQDPNRNSHAVVVYGYGVSNRDDVKLWVYDPNHPGETRYIYYDDSTGNFESYHNNSNNEYVDVTTFWADGALPPDIADVCRSALNEEL